MTKESLKPMTASEKLRNAWKALSSTATLNGGAATLMSYDMGAASATGVYLSAALAGAVNKYRALNNGGDAPKTDGFFLRILTDPSITPKIFMGAAAANFMLAAYSTVAGAPEDQSVNALRMAGWVCGFLGDNAMRRLDAANYRTAGTVAVKGSRLRETFNALTVNPTLFYNGASVAFTLSLHGGGSHAAAPSAAENLLLYGAVGLILAGTAHAVKRTWDAAQGRIATDKINDGVMNACSSVSKGMQSMVTTMAGGHPWLAAAQSIFTISNIKVIFETRRALGKKTPEETTAPSIP